MVAETFRFLTNINLSLTGWCSDSPAFGKLQTVSSNAKNYDVTNIKADTQKLIDYSVDFACMMLTDSHEFYPFAGTINLNGEIVMESHFDGDDHPLSQDIINSLEPLLDKQLEKNERRAYALTYDVRVQKDSSSGKTDAIAIKIKHKETKDITVYYFAYRLTEQKTVEHLDSWGVIVN